MYHAGQTLRVYTFIIFIQDHFSLYELSISLAIDPTAHNGNSWTSSCCDSHRSILLSPMLTLSVAMNLWPVRRLIRHFGTSNLRFFFPVQSRAVRIFKMNLASSFLFYLFSFEKNGLTLIYMSRINTERLFSCQLFSSQFWYDAFYQPWILHLLCFKPDSLYRGVNPIYLPTFYVFFSHNQILSMFGCPMLTSTFVSARQWQCTKML